MTPERFRQIESLYHAALECSSEERAALLSKACANDEELLQKVGALLKAHEKESDFFAQPVFHHGLALMSEKPPSLTGQKFGHYKIRSLLGEGGMGEVYDAIDTRLHRRVAVKVLLPNYANNTERIRHFQREARAAAAISHPNVALVYESGECNGRYFMAMEYVEGETLRRRIAMGPSPLQESLDIVGQVTAALAAAHEVGIAHRDIKPENVMMVKEAHVKVLDFGLAKRIEPLTTNSKGQAVELSTLFETTPGIIMGTLPYMSPEQARGQAIDARTDLWSLGVMFFEMLTGKLPFNGETPSDIIVAVLEHNPPPLALLLNGVPAKLQKIITKTLTKDLNLRYQTAQELYTDLKSLNEELAVESKRQATIFGRILLFCRYSAAAVARGLISMKNRFHTARLAVQTLIISALLLIAVLVLIQFTPLEEPFSRIDERDFLENGNVLEAAISPDNKFVAFVTEGSDQQSLGLKWIESAKEELLPQNQFGSYSKLAISRDGNDLYYSLFTQSAQGALHRTSIRRGEVSKKLIDNVDTPVSFSLDGQRIAFIRRKQSEPPELIIANADGSSEQKLISDKRLTLGGLAWSPKNDALACAVYAGEDEKHQTVSLISLKDAHWASPTAHHWDKIDRLAWLENGQGLVLVAAEKSPLSQLWHVSLKTGEPRRITTGVDEYRSLSLTSDSKTIATVRSRRQSRIRITSFPSAESQAKELAVGKNVGTDGLIWTPDQRIVYTSTTQGSRNLWVVDESGESSRQLTQNVGAVRQPVASPDNKYVVFVSDHDGAYKIWRIDLSDGGNLTRLTNGPDDTFPTISPDGTWVIYSAQTDTGRTLWKVPILGGKAEPLTDYLSNWPSISPDGKYIACLYRAPSENASIELAVTSLSGGKPVIKFPLPAGIAVPPDLASPGFHWSSDSRFILYIVTSKGISNIWQQPISGGASKRLTNFTSDRIFWFDISRKTGYLVYSRGQYLHDGVLINDLSNYRRKNNWFDVIRIFTK